VANRGLLRVRFAFDPDVAAVARAVDFHGFVPFAKSGSATVSSASSGLVDSCDWVAVVTCPAYFGDRSFREMKVPQCP
jgi:hypothetical protein